MISPERLKVSKYMKIISHEGNANQNQNVNPRMAIIKKAENNKYCQERGKIGTLAHCGNRKWYTCFGIRFGSSSKG